MRSCRTFAPRVKHFAIKVSSMRKVPFLPNKPNLKIHNTLSANGMRKILRPFGIQNEPNSGQNHTMTIPQPMAFASWTAAAMTPLFSKARPCLCTWTVALKAGQTESGQNSGVRPKSNQNQTGSNQKIKTTLANLTLFNPFPMTKIVPFADKLPCHSPSPGGNASSERGERHYMCCSFVDEGELTLNPQLTQLSTFFTPSQSSLFDPIRGVFLQKNSQFFSGHFDGKTLENQAKNIKKTAQICPKNTRFLMCFKKALTIQTGVCRGRRRQKEDVASGLCPDKLTENTVYPATGRTLQLPHDAKGRLLRHTQQIKQVTVGRRNGVGEGEVSVAVKIAAGQQHPVGPWQQQVRRCQHVISSTRPAVVCPAGDEVAATLPDAQESRHGDPGEWIGGIGRRRSVAEDRFVHVCARAIIRIRLIKTGSNGDIHGAGTGGNHDTHLGVAQHIGRGRCVRAEEHGKMPGGTGEIIAVDGQRGTGGTGALAQIGHGGSEINDVEVTRPELLEAAKNIVQVPDQANAVGGINGGGRAGDIHGAADVREDEPILLHGVGHDLRLRPHGGDERVHGAVVPQSQPCAEGQIAGGAHNMRSGINVLVADDAGGQGQAQRMVDGALASLRRGQPFIRPREAGENGESRSVGGGPTERAKLIRVVIPNGFLCRMPLAVGVGRFINRIRVRRPCRPIKLIPDIIILVPDEEVGVAALVGVIAGAIRVRAVLIIALNDGVGRYRRGKDVALAGVIINDHADLGGGVAVHDIEGNAIQGAGAVGRAVRAPIRMDFHSAADGGNDAGGIGRHWRGADVLVPRIIRGKKILAEQLAHGGRNCGHNSRRDQSCQEHHAEHFTFYLRMGVTQTRLRRRLRRGKPAIAKVCSAAAPPYRGGTA